MSSTETQTEATDPAASSLETTPQMGRRRWTRLVITVLGIFVCTAVVGWWTLLRDRVVSFPGAVAVTYLDHGALCHWVVCDEACGVGRFVVSRDKKDGPKSVAFRSDRWEPIVVTDLATVAKIVTGFGWLQSSPQLVRGPGGRVFIFDGGSWGFIREPEGNACYCEIDRGTVPPLTVTLDKFTWGDERLIHLTCGVTGNETGRQTQTLRRIYAVADVQPGEVSRRLSAAEESVVEGYFNPRLTQLSPDGSKYAGCLGVGLMSLPAITSGKAAIQELRFFPERDGGLRGATLVNQPLDVEVVNRHGSKLGRQENLPGYVSLLGDYWEKSVIGIRRTTDDPPAVFADELEIDRMCRTMRSAKLPMTAGRVDYELLSQDGRYVLLGTFETQPTLKWLTKLHSRLQMQAVQQQWVLFDTESWKTVATFESRETKRVGTSTRRWSNVAFHADSQHLEVPLGDRTVTISIEKWIEATRGGQ